MLNNEGCEVYITGDINNDFFRYNPYNQASEYLDMLVSLGYLPIITKPTRITDHSAALIDHIFTNIQQKVVKSGICLAGITGHLPIFYTFHNKLPTYDERKYLRDFSRFKDEPSFNDPKNLNFNPGGVTNNIFIRGGSAPRSDPLPFYIPFLVEKIPLSYTFHWKIVPLSQTYLRTLHPLSSP